jgi:hypothetical protein
MSKPNPVPSVACGVMTLTHVSVLSPDAMRRWLCTGCVRVLSVSRTCLWRFSLLPAASQSMRLDSERREADRGGR